MKFDRYLRFYGEDEQVLTFGENWGVYEYPDGQNQIWFDSRHQVLRSTACLNHPAIMDLVSQIPEAIGPISLFVTYLYGARSDKSTSGSRVVCNVAAKSRAMLKRVTGDRELSVLAPHDCNDDALPFRGILDSSQYDGVVFPDASAKLRLSWLAGSFDHEIVCEKARDQQSGEIVGFKPIGKLKGSRYLVADDLCDGGATFIRVAQMMPGCLLDLSVIHGVFSGRALDRLFSAGYARIWTTNSYVQHLTEDEIEIQSRCNVQNVW